MPNLATATSALPLSNGETSLTARHSMAAGPSCVSSAFHAKELALELGGVNGITGPQPPRSIGKWRDRAMKPCKCGSYYRTTKGKREGPYGVLTTLYHCRVCDNKFTHQHPPRTFRSSGGRPRKHTPDFVARKILDDLAAHWPNMDNFSRAQPVLIAMKRLEPYFTAGHTFFERTMKQLDKIRRV